MAKTKEEKTKAENQISSVLIKYFSNNTFFLSSFFKLFCFDLPCLLCFFHYFVLIRSCQLIVLFLAFSRWLLSISFFSLFPLVNEFLSNNFSLIDSLFILQITTSSCSFSRQLLKFKLSSTINILIFDNNQ